mgnify:CR=1 FL=1
MLGEKKKEVAKSFAQGAIIAIILQAILELFVAVLGETVGPRVTQIIVWGGFVWLIAYIFNQ